MALLEYLLITTFIALFQDYFLFCIIVPTFLYINFLLFLFYVISKTIRCRSPPLPLSENFLLHLCGNYDKVCLPALEWLHFTSKGVLQSICDKMCVGEFSGSSMVRTQHHSLVRELRSYMPQAQPKKKKKKITLNSLNLVSLKNKRQGDLLGCMGFRVYALPQLHLPVPQHSSQDASSPTPGKLSGDKDR